MRAPGACAGGSGPPPLRLQPRLTRGARVIRLAACGRAYQHLQPRQQRVRDLLLERRVADVAPQLVRVDLHPPVPLVDPQPQRREERSVGEAGAAARGRERSAALARTAVAGALTPVSPASAQSSPLAQPESTPAWSPPRR